ncbi:MAG: M14 family metallocarboxypeptidase [Myxococcales bacterium]|nr:M14 family metallocarboxypeptidase [Myxococcales bacterium]
MDRFYPIGTPGRPWGPDEKAAWLAQREIQRSYHDEVRARLEGLDPALRVSSYGALSIDPERYPLLAVTPAQPIAGAPWALVTGGVHGYETSGVQGALDFVRSELGRYRDRINVVVAPCVSPWGYERIHRWNPDAVDPNRSFTPDPSDSPAEESAALLRLIAGLGVDFLVHIDLHETTDSDESEFRPALAARDGQAFEPGLIPDGFYTVGDSENPQEFFQAAIIAAVAPVTHIAPADDNGEIIGSAVTQPGVINYPFVALGLCAGITGARFTTTTEVYPDSPQTSPQRCNQAQVAAVCAALDFALGA